LTFPAGQVFLADLPRPAYLLDSASQRPQSAPLNQSVRLPGLSRAFDGILNLGHSVAGRKVHFAPNSRQLQAPSALKLHPERVKTGVPTILYRTTLPITIARQGAKLRSTALPAPLSTSRFLRHDSSQILSN
jgi:hypothetical protein